MTITSCRLPHHYYRLSNTDKVRGLIERDEHIAALETELLEAKEIISTTYGMGFYYVDQDSGLTHKDVCRRVRAMFPDLEEKANG